jgi:hypothetical protein
MLAVRVTSMGLCDVKKAGAGTSFGASCGVVGWAVSAVIARRAQQRKALVNAFATDASHEREVSVAMGLSRDRGDRISCDQPDHAIVSCIALSDGMI